MDLNGLNVHSNPKQVIFCLEPAIISVSCKRKKLFDLNKELRCNFIIKFFERINNIDRKDGFEHSPKFSFGFSLLPNSFEEQTTSLKKLVNLKS